MDEGRKRSRQGLFYFPGVGFVKKTKYYQLRKEDLEKKGDSSSLSTPADPIPSTSHEFSATEETHDEDVDDADILDGDEFDEVVVTVEEALLRQEEDSRRESYSNITAELQDTDSVAEEEEHPHFLLPDDEEDELDEDDEEDAVANVEMCGGREPMSVEELKTKLALWLSLSRVTVKNSRSLLELLRQADPHSMFSQLPRDPRSLLQRSGSNEDEVPVPKTMELGEFVYLGVKRTLLLDQSLFDKESSQIQLTFHVDGLPLFNTSPMKFWPILGSIGTGPVFLIALYRGLKDPQCPHGFLKDFIDEILPYLHHGIELHSRHYAFKLHCLLADAPARAFVLGMKYHTGYYSCSKCKIKGIRSEGRTCFPMIDNLEKRLASNFYVDTDQEWKDNTACPLARIPLEHFDFVERVVLDSMHLIYIGVFNRLIETWLGNTAGYRRLISATSVALIDERMGRLYEFYPCEFQRSPRVLSMLSKWRAHEYRQFLLYIVYSVMHDILSEEHLSHVLLLQMYCRLLTTVKGDREIIDFCIKLAELFIVTSCELFGDKWAVYNVHGLLHLPEDVFKFLGMEAISCFRFESFLYFIKRLVRSGRHPLKQAINRWLEYLFAREALRKFGDENGTQERNFAMETSHPLILPEYPEYNKYKRLTCRNFVLKSTRKGDSCCLLEDKHFIEVHFFARAKTTGQLFIVGYEYRNSEPLYHNIECSSLVGLSRLSRLGSEMKFYSIDEANKNNIIKKVYRLPLFGTKDFVGATLLHSLY